VPIILLRKIDPNIYVPIFPVYVVGDDPVAGQFLIALDESLRFLHNPLAPSEVEKRYAERLTLQRLHQPEFRGRVIRAYRTQCTVCTLRHGELLDAAHIIADRDSAGAPVVSNGLSLCKIHHAAYDRNLLAVRPDYVVEINKSLLAEIDGPMLKHGLQEMHGRSIVLPVRRSERPDRDRLEQRYDVFRAS
jgi:putative restriction endonuclease